MSPPRPLRHRAQHPRLRPPGARLVGEDVVDLVTTAPLEPAHVGTLAVAVLELRLGLGLPSGSKRRVLLLGKAEVDERTVPGVAERHTAVFRA